MYRIWVLDKILNRNDERFICISFHMKNFCRQPTKKKESKRFGITSVVVVVDDVFVRFWFS